MRDVGGGIRDQGEKTLKLYSQKKIVLLSKKTEMCVARRHLLQHYWYKVPVLHFVTYHFTLWACGYCTLLVQIKPKKGPGFERVSTAMSTAMLSVPAPHVALVPSELPYKSIFS